ncbi:TPM domain-containing protein [Myroides sp. LJL116]
MKHIENFLTSDQEAEVVQAIARAEENTSGEIRVHIETKTDVEPYTRATHVFEHLGMFNTQKRNAILFYVCMEPKAFVILGDKGINNLVEKEHFWESTKELVIDHFRQGKFKDGLISGITKAGKKLESLFPKDELSTNEISNEISKS